MRRLSNLLRPRPSRDALYWSCHACGEVRQDAAIAVATRTLISGGVEIQMNVRYCADQLSCFASAQQILRDRQRALGLERIS